MDSQVLSSEQMQELIELGINVSKASMMWYDAGEEIGWVVGIKNCSFEPSEGDIPAFTLQDILGMLHDITIDGITYGAFVSYTFCRYEHLNGTHFTKDNSVDILKECVGTNSLEAAFNMLKWIKQNNFI